MPALDLSSLESMVPLRAAEPTPPPRLYPNKRRLLEVLKRLIEIRGEGMSLYRPLPIGAEFHACRAKITLLEGSNRSGKTEANCAELVRALTGCDPFGKYPKRNGVALVVGLKEDNVAMLWRKMAEPGSFKVVRDERTRSWRAVRPDPFDPLHLDPYDLAYQEQWKDAPPLLAPRFLPKHSIAWSDFGKGVPRTIKIPSTGWRMEMRPSGSRPDQGDHYNFVLNDEEMERPDWYYEEVRGLVGLSERADHTPRLIWSATSQVANPEFAELREKALANVKGFARFVFLIKDNPYVPDAEKAAFLSSLPEHEIETRYHGIPAISRRRIYGSYDPLGIHGCEPFEVPLNWARYAIVDPGTGKCATLLVAVDPNEKHVWVYEGFVLQNASATEWAYTLSERLGGCQLEAVYMDERAGKQTSFNASETTAQRFASALDAADIQPCSFGPMAGFFPGTADVKTRTLALRSLMVPRTTGAFVGLPTLQVAKGCCPELDKQIKSAISDRKDPEKRAKIEGHDCDLLDCCEYTAGADIRYREPTEIVKQALSPAVADFLQLQRKHRPNNSPCASLG